MRSLIRNIIFRSRWPRHLKTPLPPLWPVFQALSGEQIAQKAPLGQKRHSGLGKKRNRSIEHLQITSSVFYYRSIFEFPLHLACPRLPKNLTQEEELIRRRPAKSFPTTKEMLNKILKSESVENWEFLSE